MSYPKERRYPRLPVLMECHVDGSSGHAEMRLTDLSPVGCYVDTNIVFPPETRVSLSVMLGDAEVKLTGRVVAMPSTGYGFGVEFVDLDDSTRRQLEAYIQTRGE